ncbi:MAG: hypothetical protein C0621_09095 [Desulfuromonas sp.]|nr:MAG: hypothetical protein C0621_09095 [Desulfuromonas sp.]
MLSLIFCLGLGNRLVLFSKIEIAVDHLQRHDFAPALLQRGDIGTEVELFRIGFQRFMPFEIKRGVQDGKNHLLDLLKPLLQKLRSEGREVETTAAHLIIDQIGITFQLGDILL